MPVIWNKIIRFTHWFVAGVIILNSFILEEGDPPHRYLGYASLVLVLFRICYGFKSTGAHSFSSFPISVLQIKEFLHSKLNSEKKNYSGHNPVASLVYIFIWIFILFLGLTGWMMGLDYFFGEDWLKNIHEIFADGLKILILAHFVGIILDAVQFKRKSWMSMITGCR